MAYQWYIESDGQKQGPYSSADLKRFAESGKLTYDHLVWRQGLSAWIEAGRVDGLFSEKVQPPPLPNKDSLPVPIVTANAGKMKGAKRKRQALVVGAIVVALLMIGIVHYLASDRQIANTQQSDGVKSIDKPAATPTGSNKYKLALDSNTSLSDSELEKAYDNNQLHADKLYLGKVLLVSGTVIKIETTGEHDLYCLMDSRSDNSRSASQVNSVACEFDAGDTESEDAVAKFNQGDQVFIWGKCMGLADGAYGKLVSLAHCKVDKLTDEEKAEAKASRMTREEFQQHFAELQKTGGKSGRKMNVTGADLIEAFGKPDKSWLSGPQSGYYDKQHYEWRCSDGSVEIAMRGGEYPIFSARTVDVAYIKEHTTFIIGSTYGR